MWAMFVCIGMLFSTLGNTTDNTVFHISAVLLCTAGLISALSNLKKKK